MFYVDNEYVSCLLRDETALVIYYMCNACLVLNPKEIH
jgi:hypothetical protein